MDIEEEIAAKIREVDGNHAMGASALAAALMPLIRRAQADKVREAAELVLDEHKGLPFDHDHDLVVVAAWLDEHADEIEKGEQSGSLQDLGGGVYRVPGARVDPQTGRYITNASDIEKGEQK